MIPVISQPLPARNTSLFGPGGLATSWYYLLRALHLRTGGVNGIPFTVGANLTATGTMQEHALALNDDYNEILHGSGGVVMAKLQPAQTQSVFNGLGGNLNVYPFPGGQIDASAVNAAYVLGAGKTQVFTGYSRNAQGFPFYRSLQLG